MISLAGAFASLPTPFRDGAIDLAAFGELVDFQAARRSAGILVAGITGEGATLYRDERAALIELALARAAKGARPASRERSGGRRARIKVLASVGTADTRASCDLAKDAARLGVDALLVVTPPMCRPTRLGLARHFAAIAAAAEGLPIVLHNSPARTGLDVAPGEARALASEVPSIVALLESRCDPVRIRSVVEESGLAVLAGSDRMLEPFVRAGAVGSIGVVANLVPTEVAALIAASRAGGDPREIRRREEALAPLIDALSVETNPGPIKYALHVLGVGTGELRAPLAELEPAHRAGLAAALTAARLLVPL